MRVFVTGASGFIGSAIVKELLSAGHQVLGLARSDASAATIVAAGAEVHRGSLEDLDSLKSGAEATDGVIHTAFNHDFSQFAANCALDGRAIEALGEAMAGSSHPLIVTSGTGLRAPGQVATEDTKPLTSPHLPRVSEEMGLSMVARGVRAMVVRLPQVHDPIKQGFVSLLIDVARQKGVSAYIGDGLNHWSAVHVTDAARAYRLALEKGKTGVCYHAVAEGSITIREIAEAIGRVLKIPVVSKTPEEAAVHFGWLAGFTGFDLPSSSNLTQEWLGWHPTGPGLIADLDKGLF